MHSVEAIYRAGVFRPLEHVTMIENQRVRLIINPCADTAENKQIRTAQDLAESDLTGLWADRSDISSGSDFASRLRKEAEIQRGLKDAAR